LEIAFHAVDDSTSDVWARRAGVAGFETRLIIVQFELDTRVRAFTLEAMSGLSIGSKSMAAALLLLETRRGAADRSVFSVERFQFRV
jgi:hypothetical protein